MDGQILLKHIVNILYCIPHRDKAQLSVYCFNDHIVTLYLILSRTDMISNYFPIKINCFPFKICIILLLDR